MLHAICGYVKTKTKNTRIVESIRYRNLAPLYCDEEMRICGTLKDSQPDEDVYDIWVEGPTGGVAVKGTVRTVQKPRSILPRSLRRSDGTKSQPSNQSNVASDKPVLWKSILRNKSTNGAAHAPPTRNTVKRSAETASAVSDINVALGWDDITESNSIQQPQTSVRPRVDQVQSAAPNSRLRQISPDKTTQRGFDDSVTPPSKFSRLLRPSSASEDNAPLAISTKIEPDAQVDPPVSKKARSPRRPWRHVRTLKIRKYEKISSTSQRSGTVSSPSKPNEKRPRRDRSYTSARQPSHYGVREYLTSRSHPNRRYDRRVVRLIAKQRIRRLGETKIPPYRASARYGLVR